MPQAAFTVGQLQSVLFGWGELRPEWIALIEPFIRGQEVWAMGCGSKTEPSQFLQPSHEIGFLLRLGAAKIYAVDKDFDRFPCSAYERSVFRYDDAVTLIRSTYAKFQAFPLDGKIPVLFTKFPPQYRLQWLHLLQLAEVIVYVGFNNEATACGDKDFWLHVAERQVLVSAEGAKSNLIVYGKPGVVSSTPRPKEEQNGIAQVNYSTARLNLSPLS
jgi:hypothetical protein